LAVITIISGINDKKLNGACQPPKKISVITKDITIILQYSARKNIANVIAEYSTLYPATSSDSASGRSKGVRFVSASNAIKNTRANGKKGRINHAS